MRNLAEYIAARLSITSQRGVTAIEYGLIASLISVSIIGVLTLVGSKLTNTFNTIANGLKQVAGGSGRGDRREYLGTNMTYVMHRAARA